MVRKGNNPARNFRNNECCIISLVIAKSNVTLSKIMFCLRMCVFVYVKLDVTASSGHSLCQMTDYLFGILSR